MTSRRSTLFGALTAAVLLGSTLLAGQAQAGHGHQAPALAQARPPVDMPRHPVGLAPSQPMGTAVDPPSTYAPQSACVARALPGTSALRRLTLATYGRGGSSPATPRPCTSGGVSEHKDGRAWDWMVNVHDRADRAAAADFLAWLTGPGPSGVQGEMAYRLGVMYVIYNSRIWAAYSPGWRRYTGYDDHTTHVHVSLSWNGARGSTSFWTGHVSPVDLGPCQIFAGQPANVPGARPRLRPCEAPVAVVRRSTEALDWLGSTGPAVSTAQRLLGLAVDGRFDAHLRSRVLRYQHHHDLPRTGALDEPTWASLLPSARAADDPAWTRRTALAWSRRAGWPDVRRSDAGRSVYALQVLLGADDSRRTGYYGRSTRAHVIAFKRAHGLPATALVDTDVWNALRRS